ncbi:MAG: hypothetical protein GMKNLPBB_01091 [Myxococcota bacterium]|nr:hypothetical protein [Myxococcota bacterium]
MRRISLLLFAVSVPVFVACGGEDTPAKGGFTGAGSTGADGGAGDSGLTDLAGPPVNPGGRDSGVPPADAGSPDTGVPDTAAPDSGNPPTPGLTPEQQEWIDAHNAARRDRPNPPANPPLGPLRWSKDMEAKALAWGRECKWKHNPNTMSPAGVQSGENLYAGTQRVTPTRVVTLWAEEVKDYDYHALKCRAGAQCGHYTQVVWRDTTEVGCVMVECPNGLEGFRSGRWYAVCNYAPPGNYVGEKPY